MQELKKPIIVGAVIGALAAGILALPSLLPSAMADEEPARTLLKSSDEIFRKPIDGADFVKPDWTIEPWVATEPLSQTTVRKIGYGRTEYVSIVTTATGTYSSDGLASRNVLYPGITENARPSSFRIVVRHDSGASVVRDGSFCTITRYGKFC